jgi:ubiquinone/menaquinone biosynthesis C-methylase UbiE
MATLAAAPLLRTIYRLPKRPERAILAANRPESGECRMKSVASALIAVACRISQSARRLQQLPRELPTRSEHEARIIASKGKFLLLSEKQSVAFDTEFHSQEELDNKFLLLKDFSKDRHFNVLDLGGGNGFFADRLLERFPKSAITILDTSSELLAKNQPSIRKELIHGSIEYMTDILTGRTFDCITVNWVFHHLVGNSYLTCRKNCLDTLMKCKELLKPNGLVIVAENMFDGYLGANLPSHLIYAITSTAWPWFVRLASRFFNTAGVGVCFQSQRAWRHMFAEAEFDVIAFQRGLVWWWLGRSFRGILIHMLFVKSVSHGHFFLKLKRGHGVDYHDVRAIHIERLV